MDYKTIKKELLNRKKKKISKKINGVHMMPGGQMMPNREMMVGLKK
jgi:hypothetical protein